MRAATRGGWVAVASLLLGLSTVSAAQAAQFFWATGSLDSSDPTQSLRLQRVDPTSSCGAVKTTPVVLPDAPEAFDSYSLQNRTQSSQCVTATLDPMTCVGVPLALQSAAYLPSFDPTNPALNYLADIGGSPTTGAKSYSFTVPPRAPFAVTVNVAFGGSSCPSYGLTLSSNLPWAFTQPAIDGTPTVGTLQTALPGDWAGSPTLAIRWQRCTAVCTAIAGAVGKQATYTPTAADLGTRLRIKVTAVEGGLKSTATSARTSTIT